MLDLALITFTTLFAIIGPVDNAAIFAAMTAGQPARARRAMALRGVLIATGVLLVFAFAGEFILTRLGITLDAMRIAGGILLLMIAIDLVFGRHSTASYPTEDEAQEAKGRADISVFPLAVPLLSGPGTMGAMILLIGNTEGDVAAQAVVIGAMISVMALSLVLLLLATQLQRLVGLTAMNVVSRVFGVLLSALAVQFMINGLKGIGAFA